MLTEICPSDLEVYIAPVPVSITTTRNAEARVLEVTNTGVREGSRIVIQYSVTGSEMDLILEAVEVSLFSYSSFPLPQYLKSLIGLNPKNYEFAPVWRHTVDPVKVGMGGGVYTTTLEIKNVLS